jgi:hypothetical protein
MVKITVTMDEKKKQENVGLWIAAILMFFVFPPIGVFLFLMALTKTGFTGFKQFRGVVENHEHAKSLLGTSESIEKHEAVAERIPSIESAERRLLRKWNRRARCPKCDSAEVYVIDGRLKCGECGYEEK